MVTLLIIEIHNHGINMLLKLKNYIFIITIALMVVLVPTAQDAVRAYKVSENDDGIRLFKYYTTARYYGVPVALERYGVK